MPFDRPTLTELISRIAADIESRLPSTDARLRRNVLNVLARTFSGAAHGLHGHLDWIARQVIYDTAEAEILERWATIWGLARTPAVAAQGDVIITGTNGSVIPSETILQRSDGAEFSVDGEETIAAGSATLAVTAATAGADGNTDASVTLSLVNPIDGVASTGVVATGGIAGGVDIETDDNLRARLLFRIQNPPHGGAETDYELWALEVAGVTRAWVYPQELGAGTVTVRIVTDDADSGPIPDAQTVEAVQDHIDALRPVTAEVTVVAPVAVALDFTVSITPDTSAVRAAVEAELADLLRREAEPEGGAGEGTILISHIREAISAAAGETDHTLTNPAADVIHDVGEMAVMGAITWA